MKYFIASDIHGFFDEWMTALDDAGFDISNPEHVIVVLGDLMDRGRQVPECLEFLMTDLHKERRILIKGNHEDLLEELIARKSFEYYDITNGTHSTINQLIDAYVDDYDLCTSYDYINAVAKIPILKKYLDECVDYYELDNNIFVHGWIPTNTDDWRNGNWADARWYNGMKSWNDGYIISGKTIWCGHWHASWGHSVLHQNGPQFDDEDEFNSFDENSNKLYAHSEPFIDTHAGCKIVAMDACCAYFKRINVEVIEI